MKIDELITKLQEAKAKIRGNPENPYLGELRIIPGRGVAVCVQSGMPITQETPEGMARGIGSQWMTVEIPDPQ